MADQSVLPGFDVANLLGIHEPVRVNLTSGKLIGSTNSLTEGAVALVDRKTHSLFAV